MTGHETHDEMKPEADEKPDELVLTSTSWEGFRQESSEHARSFDEGGQPPRTISFEDASELRSLLTPRRLELVETLMTHDFGSIREVARHLDRGVREVHEDLELLAEYGIVEFEKDGASKAPRVPHETVRVEIEIRAANV
jgi:predicted transcriptional regulator